MPLHETDLVQVPSEGTDAIQLGINAEALELCARAKGLRSLAHGNRITQERGMMRLMEEWPILVHLANHIPLALLLQFLKTAQQEVSFWMASPCRRKSSPEANAQPHWDI